MAVFLLKSARGLRSGDLCRLLLSFGTHKSVVPKSAQEAVESVPTTSHDVIFDFPPEAESRVPCTRGQGRASLKLYVK